MIKTSPISQAEARHLAEACATLLREQFAAKRVIIFGSVAGDTPWHSQSDIDIAVEGLSPDLHWQALNACYALLPATLSLDLIPLEDAWPELHTHLAGEFKMPENSKEALAIEISNELKSLERLIQESADFLSPEVPPLFQKMQIQSVAKSLHDFYNGAERIFERIAVRLDGGLPVGNHWHTLLLQQMENPYGSHRPAVITHQLQQDLAEYLRFRHIFRHTYGYDLKWHRVKELGEELPRILSELKNQLAFFLQTTPD